MTEFIHGAQLGIWDRETRARLHDATLTVLETTGVEVHHEGALKLLADAGARVEGTRVRIAAGTVADALASAPRSFELKSRGAAAVMQMDAAHTYLGTGSDCLYVLDPDSHERRRARVADIQGMAAITELLPNVASSCRWVCPKTLPRRSTTSPSSPPCCAAHVSRCCSPPETAASSRQCRRWRRPAARRRASASTPCRRHPSRTRPRQSTSSSSAASSASRSCTPRRRRGATAPMSRAAVALSGNAETLSGLVIHQLANPGAPFIYGAAQGALNLRTSVELYRAPEAYAVQHAGRNSLGTTTCPPSRSAVPRTESSSTASGPPRRHSP